MGTIVESVSLHYTDGGRSDKVYNIELEAVAPNQFNVTGYNGKRGGTLTPRKQNDIPVSFAEAKRLFDNLELEKRNHRKTPYVVTSRNGSSTTSASRLSGSSSTNTFETTGYVANHPKKVSEEDALRLLDNDDYFLEQKCDGVFMAVHFQQDRVTASHKSGNGVPVPIEIEAAIRQLASLAGCEVSLGLAGEYLDSTLHVFTVWEKNGTSLLSLPQHLRIALKDRLELILTEHLGSSDAKQSFPLRFVGTAKTKADKIALYQKIKAGSGEGVVFKHHESDISFKYKLYETTEVLLIANSQRSAECFAYHAGILISLGSATLPNNSIHEQIKEANCRQQPIVGSVKYLYLSAPPVIGPGCGQLTQASFLRFRPDFDEHSCVTTELKIVNKTVLSLTADAVETGANPTASATTPQALDQLLFPMLSTSS